MTFIAKASALLAASVLVASLLPGPFADIVTAPAKPIFEDAQLDEDARRLAGRACQNCHSNSTVWPWYGRVAPVSWMLRQDVANARKFMNFSRWPEYGREGRIQLLGLAASQVENRVMPPARYRAFHPDADLPTEDRRKFAVALRAEAARLTAETQRRINP